MTKNKLKEKISKFIYERGVNTSSRYRVKPIDDEKVTDDAQISVINIGLDIDTGLMFIRAKFHGSNTFYTIPFEINKYDEWVSRIRELHSSVNEDLSVDDDDLDF
jgi:hypothetical protein